MRAWFLAALLLPGPALAWAAGAAATDVPVLRQHVTDQTGTLSAAQIGELEADLVALEQRKGSQLSVLVVATTGELPIEEYSLAVVEKNKLGRRKIDDGLLLLVAKDDRKARIEVGYGLEGVVTDAIASRVIREYLTPRFREGDYFGGLKDADAALIKLVDGEPLPPPMVSESDSGSGPPPLVFAVFIGLLIGMLASATALRPVTLRRLGAGGIAAVLGWLIFSAGLSAVIAAVVAFLASSSGGGRFGSGRGGWGSFPGGGGGWGGGGGGGGWSGGGGSFGGGGASGGW